MGESKTVLDSGFHAGDSRFKGPGFRSMSVEPGFWIPIVSEILNSLNCVPDSKAQDSGFHKQKFLGFRNPDSLHRAIKSSREKSFESDNTKQRKSRRQGLKRFS